MRLPARVTPLLHLLLLLGLAIAGRPAHAAPETLEVQFNLAQYQANGSRSFSLGCTSNPPGGRTNWVHISVVWLEDANGNYVTTLYRWGRTYGYNLKAWAAASDMDVDGLTRATPTSNGNNPGQVFRTFTTGAVDVSKIPDGNYRIRIESSQCETAGEYRSGTVNFDGPNATFNFTKGRAAQSGVVVGSANPFDNVTVNYVVPAGNKPPSAWAGVDRRLMPSVNPSESSVQLSAVVGDDSGMTPSVAWTQVSSFPAGLTAQIGAPTAALTTVTFTQAGIYRFRVTATDAGGLSNSDEVAVWVNARTLPATQDLLVASGRATLALGTLEDAGPWAESHGQCNGGAYGRSYFRFDLRGFPGAIRAARLRLPRGEATPNPNVHHDVYLLTDAQDDWNTTNASTDYETTTTFNNQSVPRGLSSNLQAGQLVGTLTHDACTWRHAFANPDPPPGPGSDCPGWLEVDLDVTNAGTLDGNREWSLFVSPREVCNNGLLVGTRENAVDPQLVVVEHWQSAANQPPTANAGPDRVVADTLPSGTEVVTLDGTGSRDDVSVASYTWREGAQVLGSGPTPQVSLGLGPHDVELTVTDGAGLTATDAARVVVDDRYHPNHRAAEAAVIDGDAAGKVYADLFADGADPAGDWFALDVVAGSDLDVSVTMTGGDLDLRLYSSAMTPLMSSATMAATEQVTARDLAAGRYYLQVSAVAAATYRMTVTVTGATLGVAFDPSSALESAGTLRGAGTVSVPSPVTQPLAVTLAADLPAHLGFGANPVTIPAGMSSASFDVVLTDDPAGAQDADRFVNVSATAPGFNRGSATFSILDDEGAVVVAWDKATESIDETGSPIVVLTAQLSGAAAGPVTVPFTVGGTARRGGDYVIPGGGELTISANNRERLAISILDDVEVEGPETLVITLGTPVGAERGTITEYTLTIGDDDRATGADAGAGGGSDAAPSSMDGGMIEGSCACVRAPPVARPAWALAAVLGALWLRRRARPR